jgi:membrane protein
LTIPGSLVTTAIWLVLTWCLGFYFHHFGDLKMDRLYEFLASPIALVVWLYWSAKAILFGAESNVSLESIRAVSKTNRENASQRREAAETPASEIHVEQQLWQRRSVIVSPTPRTGNPPAPAAV